MLTPALSSAAPGDLPRAGRKSSADFDYVLCDPTRHARACGLLQAGVHGASPEPIASGAHSSNREHLRAVAIEALEMISGRDCAALDIGCNDGALLSYYPRWVDRYGVDPSSFADEVGAWAWTAREAFPSPALDAAFGEKRFDIITAASVFEHIDNPAEFLSAVKARLSEDGVFAMETLYAPMALTSNAVDAFMAGVSAVYSLSVLEWLVRSAGMKVFKGSMTSKEGGSIRLFITHAENDEFDFDPWNERLARLWDEENALALRAVQPFQTFERRSVDIQARFADLLQDFANKGRAIYLLGADPHAEALLRLAGPSVSVVSAAIDTVRSRENERLFPGGPLIVSESEARAAEPDVIVAPARYKREALERWREAIMLGVEIVFATPRPHVVNIGNYAGEYGKTIAGGEDGAGVETLRAILAGAGGPRLVADNSVEIQSPSRSVG